MKKYQVKVLHVYEVEAESVHSAVSTVETGQANGKDMVDYSMSAKQVDDPTERVQGALQQFLPFLASLMGQPEPEPPTVSTGAKPKQTEHESAFEVDTTDIDTDMGDI